MIIVRQGSAISPSDRTASVWGDAERSTGPLDQHVVDDITSESESVGWAVESPNGLVRIGGDDRREVDFPVIVVVSDRRILFFAADDGAADPTDAGSIDYGQVAGTDVTDEGLEVSTVDGPRWRVPAAGVDAAAYDRTASHLRWVGEVRHRLVAARNDVEMAAGSIRQAAGEMAWEDGTEAYARMRETLDGVVDAVHRTRPIPADVLAPGLTETERCLERAYAELLIERTNSRLTLGQQLVASDDHERAREVLASVRSGFVAARDHAEVVRRGDDFVFGAQRQLRDDLERLEWEIQAVAAEPLRQAHEAKIDARSTNDPDETVEHWESAYRRYGHVLALAEGEGGHHFAGDLATVRDERRNAAGQLIAIHQALARNEWDDGVECHREGDAIGAILQLDAAVDHMDRAHELASEFRPAAADDMAARLETMRDGLQRVRVSTGAARGDPGESDGEAAADESGANGESAGPGITASELADLDTHHEITFTDGPAPVDDQGDAENGDAGDVGDSEIVLRRDDDGD